MALLGLDTLITVLGLFVFVRIGKFFEYTHTVLKDVRSLIPANLSSLSAAVEMGAEEDRSKVNPNLVNQKKRKKNQKLKSKESQEEEKEEKRVNVEFGRFKLKLVQHVFYPQLELLVTSSLLAFAVYVGSDVLYCLASAFSNTGLLGRQSSSSVLVAGISMQALTALGGITFTTWNSETQLSMVMGFLSFLWSLMFYGASPKTVTFSALSYEQGLSEAYLVPDDMKSYVWWLVASGLSLFNAVFVTVSLLPAFRYARVYHESTTMKEEKTEISSFHSTPLSQFLHHVTFFSPLVIVLLYCDSLTAEPITALVLDGSRDTWLVLRFGLVFTLTLLRVLMFTRFVQGFLDSSYLVIKYMLANPRDFTTDSILNSFNGNYRNVCTASVQYLAPAVISFFLLLAARRSEEMSLGICSGCMNVSGVERVAITLQESTLEKYLRQLVPHEMPKGQPLLPASLVGPIIHSIVVWTNAAWFVSSVIGLLYWRLSGGDSDTSRKFANLYADKNSKKKR
mmetsp:Transcript_19238/g.31581  ORF Transcript_19238/g.31581 Transcript_19238/m.31581 type:complete len:509 (+) Transcript_19238:21-1547(+)